MVDEDWNNLLDYALYHFYTLSVPFRLVRLLCHLLAVRCIPIPSETLLAKILAVSKKNTLKTTCKQILDFNMELPSLPTLCK